MIRNDVYKDLKRICLEEDTNISQVLVKAGYRTQYSQSMKNMDFVIKSLVNCADVLGYDIDVKFVKRSSAGSADEESEA